MKLKSFSLITLVTGCLLTIIGFVVPFIAMQLHFEQPGATGIIGGAGAPTYWLFVFTVMNGWPFCFMLLGAGLIVTSLFCLVFSKTVQVHCSIQTSAVSFCLSASGALGLVCAFMLYVISAFKEASKHPIAYPFSLIVGLLSLFTFIVLIAAYFKFRKNKRSVKGLIIDILTCVFYFPAFFFSFSYLHQWISSI